MKSVTIHKMDDLLAEKIRLLAEERHESMNTTMKSLLANALELPTEAAEPKTTGYAQFCGLWTDEDKAEFDAAVQIFEEIDDEDWR